MKRLFSILLIALFILSLSVGCSKKEAEVSGTDLEQAVEENNEQATKVSDENTKSDKIDYVLYLKMKNMPFLYDEMFSIDINDEKLKNKTMEEFVLDELINYKGDEQFVSPIPKGTKVISVERDGKNVIVNFSKEFLKEKMSTNDATITIGSIVNSLVVLPGNETVQIKVDGEFLKEYYGFDTSKPLSFLEGLFPDK
ncbi:Sporulation and spore germination [Caminicella sporogenes DSM 14501]|uniref:Sporulation and spore germination n=1 Tax=Caminicella sporogenes DSM 14501 TaxID=1121266 RepID=A0A1M6R2K4_9FIRM|nr:GerMN domain-containing protein [Caminicella sporogenes]RKD27288.1 hypothetical protein BET04_09095 [Caminicella sporogenes]SHK26646.1 Sporulation and spore germination [Caminicella sporogenes DSM 14501]